MKVRLVPPSVSTSEDQYLTSFLINDAIAIDAGSIGFYGTAQSQSRIKHVLISHSHLDHVASLPILVENAYEGKSDCVTVYGSAYVLTSLQQDLFNDRVWPDFIKMSEGSKAPFLKLQEIEPEIPIILEGLKITPISVNHVGPTMGFLIEEEESSVLIVSDTGPTERIWEVAKQARNLKAVYLEASFPNSMEWLAKVSGHLTPEMFGKEMAKAPHAEQFFVVHIKSRYREKIIEELVGLKQPRLRLAWGGNNETF